MGKASSTFLALVAVHVWATHVGDVMRNEDVSGAAWFLTSASAFIFLALVTDYVHAVYMEEYRTSTRRFKVLVGFAAVGLGMALIGVWVMPLGWNPVWVAVVGLLVGVVAQVATDKPQLPSGFRVPIGRRSGRSARRGR